MLLIYFTAIAKLSPVNSIGVFNFIVVYPFLIEFCSISTFCSLSADSCPSFEFTYNSICWSTVDDILISFRSSTVVLSFVNTFAPYSTFSLFIHMLLDNPSGSY